MASRGKKDWLNTGWNNAPIGYELTPNGAGWDAFMIREGQKVPSALVIATGRNKERVKRQAERYVRKMRREYEVEHANSAEQVILFDGDVS